MIACAQTGDWENNEQMDYRRTSDKVPKILQIQPQLK